MLFRKIPLIFWVIVLVILAFISVYLNWIPPIEEPSKIRLLAGFISIIGLFFVAYNMDQQRKNERIKTEYLNQPEFFFKHFYRNYYLYNRDSIEGEERKKTLPIPVICDDKPCSDYHWFDIINDGKLSAIDVKVGLFFDDEYKEKIEIFDRSKNRWNQFTRISKRDNIQFKLPEEGIKIEDFVEDENKICCLILLDYISEYSKIRYKRVVKMEGNYKSNPKDCNLYTESKNKSIFPFSKSIHVYSVSIYKQSDSYSLSIKNTIKSIYNKLKYGFNRKKKHYSLDEWLLDL